MSLDDINDNQYKRQQAVDACWNAIMAVLHERGLGAEQEDMIVLDLSAQLLHSATMLQRRLVMVKELGLSIDEAIEKLRKADIPEEYFRGVRDI